MLTSDGIPDWDNPDLNTEESASLAAQVADILSRFSSMNEYYADRQALLKAQARYLEMSRVMKGGCDIDLNLKIVSLYLVIAIEFDLDRPMRV